MTFDYRLRPGPATTRNAIRLLGLLGFPETVVEGAHRRAEDFLREGRWRTEDEVLGKQDETAMRKEVPDHP